MALVYFGLALLCGYYILAHNGTMNLVWPTIDETHARAVGMIALICFGLFVLLEISNAIGRWGARRQAQWKAQQRGGCR